MESGESDIDEDPSFPLPSDQSYLDTEELSGRAVVSAPLRTVSSSPHCRLLQHPAQSMWSLESQISMRTRLFPCQVTRVTWTRRNSQDVRLSQLRCERSAPPPTATPSPSYFRSTSGQEPSTSIRRICYGVYISYIMSIMC